jgi:ribosomal protein S12 methylthiotransferase
MKIGFVSLGCPKNLVDSEVMMGLVEAQGHELTVEPSEADAIVVNTCSFIDPAKKESIDTILEMAEFKKTGRARRLVVAGCLVERYRDDIRKQIPEVDAVLGTNELEAIVAQCEGGEYSAQSSEPYLYHDLTPRRLASARHMAYVKINEGCDHPCTFCIIPQFRGRFRSRRFESVIREATALFGQGVREINLIGQDTTAFGEDLGVKDGLPHLLERLSEIENAGWIRFLYAYPNRVTQRLLDAIAANRQVCNYIDVPLQHASAAVLKRMKRGGSGDIFLEFIERARNTVPGIGIRTSFIVGFPGETDRDFEELCQFVEEAKFDRLGVFSYSDDDLSESYHLDGKVDARTIYNRKRKLMAIQRKISRRRNRELVGQRLPILITGPSAETDLLWEGRLQTQAHDIDGKTYIIDFADGVPNPGDFGEIRITRATDYDLFGKLESVEANPVAYTSPRPSSSVQLTVLQ